MGGEKSEQKGGANLRTFLLDTPFLWLDDGEVWGLESRVLGSRRGSESDQLPHGGGQGQTADSAPRALPEVAWALESNPV